MFEIDTDQVRRYSREFEQHGDEMVRLKNRLLDIRDQLGHNSGMADVIRSIDTVADRTAAQGRGLYSLCDGSYRIAGRFDDTEDEVTDRLGSAWTGISRSIADAVKPVMITPDTVIKMRSKRMQDLSALIY